MKSIADRKLEPFPKLKRTAPPAEAPPAPVTPEPIVAARAATSLPASRPAEDQEFPHSVSLRLDVALLDSLKNAVVSAQTAGDYRFTSMSSAIRAALRAHSDGMPLSAVVPPGVERKKRSFTLDEELKGVYERIPPRKRAEIIERIIRTYMRNGLTWTGSD